ncbi:MAG TPA: ADOP family duplicated permease [Vicinamibacterales bacterium]
MIQRDFAAALRVAVRRIRRAPLFSTVIIITIALGVGASAALFSALNALWLRSLPISHPEALVAISQVYADGRVHWMPIDTVAEIARQTMLFEDVCGYAGGGILTTEIGGSFEGAPLEFVSGACTRVLDTKPFLGRLISDREASLDGAPAPVAVLGYGYWQRHFGDDPGAVGRTIRVSGVPLTIIGVAGPHVTGLQDDGATAVTVPVTLLNQLLGDPPGHVASANYAIARLRPGVTLAQARTRLSTLWPAIAIETVPASMPPRDRAQFTASHVSVESAAGGFSYLRDDYARPILMLVGLAGLLLLLTCVNLSGLLLTRAAAGEHDLAIQLAIGASRRRLALELLVESVVHSGLGTIVALPLAWWADRALERAMSAGSIMAATLPLTPDVRVLAIMAVCVFVIGVAVGTLPARFAGSRRGEERVLQSQHGAAPRRGRLGGALVTVQVTISFALLVGAGLLAQNLRHLRQADLGFHTDHVLIAALARQPDGYRDTNEAAYFRQLVSKLSALPGVTSVSLGRRFTTLGRGTTPTTDPISPARGDDTTIQAITDIASPGFFDTIGITRIAGRDFTWRDTTTSPPVAIVTAGAAHTLFPSSEAIGQQVRVGNDPKEPSVEIVGVIGDISMGDATRRDIPVLFRPALQQPAGARSPQVEIRTRVPPEAVTAAVRRTVASMGQDYVIYARTLDDRMADNISSERLAAAIASLFAALALLLALIGLYGVLAYGVARRTREIGVRLALGASPRGVLRMVLLECGVLAGLGIAAGAPLAIAVGRSVGALLAGVQAWNPEVLIATALLFLVAALGAGLIPARHACRIDPMEALRSE